jgi:hypothetical protein
MVTSRRRSKSIRVCFSVSQSVNNKSGQVERIKDQVDPQESKINAQIMVAHL